ncbi:MAG: hypothetical protein NTY77_16580 [Elusimicrobia bacterium]|nr:hypothetical protein [Elusimicrobiota bacterium]
MRKVTQSGFDEHLQQVLKDKPALAKAHAEQFAQLPLATQLSIMRRRRWLSQKSLAKTLRAKQPHVARMESSRHDPRLSSIQDQARALHCHLLLVPDELLAKVARLVALGQAASAAR